MKNYMSKKEVETAINAGKVDSVKFYKAQRFDDSRLFIGIDGNVFTSRFRGYSAKSVFENIESGLGLEKDETVFRLILKKGA